MIIYNGSYFHCFVIIGVLQRYKIKMNSKKKRATSETRTRDPRVTNALLYQLSYCGLFSATKI